jgi:hypothetical protein
MTPQNGQIATIGASPRSILLALHQELFRPLMDTGGPSAKGIEIARREHLLKRHT